MHMHILDSFTDLAAWSPITSGQAQLTLVPELNTPAPAMRFEFDFAGGGGFVVARRELSFNLPESYAFLLDIRAAAPANAFEFKLIDRSGTNVWRYRAEDFKFTTDWHTVRIPSSAIEFGWGPAGGGVAHEVGAIEIVIAAGPGGLGQLWVANLRLEDRTPTQLPLLTASSGAHPAAALDGDPDTCWRPEQVPAQLIVDFQEERDFGGLIVHWDAAAARQFAVCSSADGVTWRERYHAPQAAGRHNPVYLPGGGSRYLRLTVTAPAGAPLPGVIALELQPEGFARSRPDFFHHLAAHAPRGRYPRWLSREQSYWTPVDVPDGAVAALFNEEGAVEVTRAGCMIEPLLTVGTATGTQLVTWAECAIHPAALRQPLPIPQSRWQWREGDAALELTVTACASREIPPDPPFSKGGDEGVSFSNDGDEKASFSNDGDKSASFSNDGDKSASFSNDGDEKASFSNDGDEKASFSNDGDEKASFSEGGEINFRLEKTQSESPSLASESPPLEKEAPKNPPLKKAHLHLPPLKKGGWGGFMKSGGLDELLKPASQQTWLHLRYHLHNQGTTPLHLGVHAALRPFQVSPAWQGWRDIGGISPIQKLAWRDGAVWVNDALALVPLTAPSGFGAAAFDEGAITDYLADGTLPAAQEVSDPFGCASAALRFDMTLAAGDSAEVLLIAPLTPELERPADWSPPAPAFAHAEAQWTAALNAVTFQLPPIAQEYLHACQGALAHMLITRDGAALHPGARRYTRSWIRDGAGMVAALLRFGRAQDAAAFIRWYAPFQAPDGNVPCCVDSDGADWLPEHDSHGQLIFVIAEYYRFTGERQLVADLWPAVQRAVAYLQQLRAQRLTDAYRGGACFGLLPESVSHEGYLAHPVHSYWDDFWALRGLKDAVQLAQVMDADVLALQWTELRDDFAATLHASLAATMRERAIEFLPGSVEWADPDPTATANALTLIDELHALPLPVLQRSFDLFMERFRAMHGAHPVAWTNYTPYEIRIIGALVRLERRDEAHELAQFFLAERRPPVWNQWPEIAWRDPRAPGHQGDLPHTWIGAEYCLAFRDLFVYERESDQALVIGAGIPAAWLAAGAIVIHGLPTAYGTLNLALRPAAAGAINVNIDGHFRVPPGGIQCALPLEFQPVFIQINPSEVANDHS
jgi:hypothetical protein